MFQDSDLKQYLDHCGNLMSMHNVKVRASTHLGTHLFQAQEGNPRSWLLFRPSNAGGREGAAPFREDREPWSTLSCPAVQAHTLCHCPAVDIKPRSLTLSEHQFPVCQMGAWITSQGEGRLLGKFRGMNGFF